MMSLKNINLCKKNHFIKSIYVIIGLLLISFEIHPLTSLANPVDVVQIIESRGFRPISIKSIKWDESCVSFMKESHKIWFQDVTFEGLRELEQYADLLEGKEFGFSFVPRIRGIDNSLQILSQKFPRLLFITVEASQITADVFQQVFPRFHSLKLLSIPNCLGIDKTCVELLGSLPVSEFYYDRYHTAGFMEGVEALKRLKGSEWKDGKSKTTPIHSRRIYHEEGSYWIPRASSQFPSPRKISQVPQEAVPAMVLSEMDAVPVAPKIQQLRRFGHRRSCSADVPTTVRSLSPYSCRSLQGTLPRPMSPQVAARA